MQFPIRQRGEAMKGIFGVAMLALLLAGCSTSDISAVQNGTLAFNKTITVGQALNNWQSCKKGTWSEFTSQNGVKVVQFACDQKVRDYFNMAHKMALKSTKEAGVDFFKDQAFKIDSLVETFQFTMNKDMTFQIDNVSDTAKWRDGTTLEQSQNAIEQLQMAYRDKMRFDSSGPDELGLESAQALNTVAVMYAQGIHPQKSVASPGSTEPVGESGGPAASGMPQFQKNEPYADVRTKLLAAGWQPFHADDADTCESGDPRCEGRPEMESCAGTGQANCKFLWKKQSRVLAICTVGEENAVFDNICSYP